jgi:type II secretory pathway component PulF
MPKFYYSGRNHNDTEVTGSLEAPDAWAARKEVKKLDLHDLEVRPASAFEGYFEKINSLRNYAGPVKVEERLVFLSQMETGLAVGIPLLVLFNLIIAEISHPRFKEAVRAVADDVAQGSSMHLAFSRYPELFDSTFIALIQTGEASGQLENVLARLFKLTEQDAENRARIKSAFFYPVIVIFFLVFVVFAVCYWVIPKIKVFLISFGQELPLITRVVVGFSDMLLAYGWVLIPIVWGAIHAFQKYYATPSGRLTVDKIKLKLPVLGPFLKQVELNNFCVVLDLLLESGVPLPDALEMLERSQSNQVYRNDITRVRGVVIGGTSFRTALAAGALFPNNLISLIGVGEEAGRVPEVLRRMAKHYQMQIDHKLQNLPKLIEPILLALIFVLVLILALAIFLPIWKMSSALKQGG